MTWNHRVIEKDGWFTVREVYYDDRGRPEACTEEAMAPEGETFEDLRAEAEQFLKAFDQPVLAWEVFACSGE